MQIDLTALPEDSGVLQSMIRDVVTATLQRDAQVTELTVENDKLRNRLVSPALLTRPRL